MCDYCTCQTEPETEYTCSRCGGAFCIDCRLPEEHECVDQIPRSWPNYIQNVKRLKKKG